MKDRLYLSLKEQEDVRRLKDQGIGTNQARRMVLRDRVKLKLQVAQLATSDPVEVRINALAAAIEVLMEDY